MLHQTKNTILLSLAPVLANKQQLLAKLAQLHSLYPRECPKKLKFR